MKKTLRILLATAMVAIPRQILYNNKNYAVLRKEGGLNDERFRKTKD